MELERPEETVSSKRNEIHVFDRNSVSQDLYCKEVIPPRVRLFREAMRPNFAFMDNNARPHPSADVQLLLESAYTSNVLVSVRIRFQFHRTCVGGFVEIPSGTIISSGEHQITETDAD
ncbi:hypothetical protein TNCV_1909061 [Trichonephila clavipes]|nr:hypothetical protein TNCV_1909061 [Trichonephila clavipes]